MCVLLKPGDSTKVGRGLWQVGFHPPGRVPSPCGVTALSMSPSVVVHQTESTVKMIRSDQEEGSAWRIGNILNQLEFQRARHGTR